MIHTHFSHLKQVYGLPQDASLDNLLQTIKKKRHMDPDNPELIYQEAEILRSMGHTDEAIDAYQKTVKLAEKRSEKRAFRLIERVRKKKDHTRAIFLLYTFAPLIVLLFIGAVTWKTISEPEKLPDDQGGDPNQFAFTQWLAKQQMVEIVSTLQEQNPELSFDFSRASSANAQTPMEFMQSLMQPDAFEHLRKKKGGNNPQGSGKGNPVFQCSLEPAVKCSPHDVPSAPGEKREEVVLLMDAYRSILATEHDCEKLEQSIDKVGKQLSWRKSEYNIKADLEDFATECFYRQKNIEKTIEHARKLQCTGSPRYINSVYWYLTAIYHQAGDKKTAYTNYQCFQEATKYIEKYHFKSTYVAARHRESGALAWLYFDDLANATAELEKARAILKKEKDKSPGLLQVASEINLDLMETYVTANIDQDTFKALHEEINSSGLLTDGYKQIKDTLAGIYYMQNHKNNEARIALNNLSRRFRLIPEFICGWDWSGFRRGLQESIADEKIRTKAIALVDATNCYVPLKISQRIKVVDSVKNSLR